MIFSDLYFERFDPDDPYPDALDADLIISDRDGHIGAFSTAGIGPIPIYSLESVVIPIENMSKELHKLPIISSAVILATDGNMDCYVTLAERGFYVYDYLDVHRLSGNDWLRHAYEIIAVPTNPITVDMLSGNIRDYIRGLEISTIAFIEEEQVDLRDYFDCCQKKD